MIAYFKEKIRGRLTVSGYHMPEKNHRNTLYGGEPCGFTLLFGDESSNIQSYRCGYQSESH
jgi:hypothetical protein